MEAERQTEAKGQITIRSEGQPGEVNIVTREDLERMSILDPLDMLRLVPGVSVQHYGDGDIGFSVNMRGFQTIHGREVAIFIDGMPMNFVQGAMSNGWADIGWLIPEMVERIEVIKGPVSALYGDFALAGVINIITRKADPSPSATVKAGTYGTYSAVGTLSNKDWNPTPFLVWEGYNRDGYRINSDYQRGQMFNKLTVPLWQGYLSSRLHYVARRWGIPGYLSINDVQAGLSRRSSVDPSDQGDAELLNFVINYGPKGGEEGFYGTFFAASHLHNSSFTFVGWPDQSRYHERRNFLGSKLLYNFVPWENFSLVVGNDTRYDDVNYVTLTTRNHWNIISTDNDYDIKQISTGFFAQAQYQPIKYFKIVGGIRYDTFNINISNRVDPANTGVAQPDVWSPKIGFVITPYKDINIFANKARGFRSPAAWELSPVGSSKNLELGVAKIDTWDVGINALLFDRVYLGFNYYDTELQREVRFNPDTGFYENIGDSKRTGFELESKIFLPHNITIYGSYAPTRARLKNPATPGAYYIRQLPEDVSTLGVDWGRNIGSDQRVNANFYYVRYGRAPLSRDGTIIGPQLDRYFAKISYQYQNWTASLEGQLTPRKYSSEYIYYSGGQIFYDPMPPWQIIAGLRYQFRQ